jgi:predicted chitinase
MGNGDEKSGEPSKFIGRGALQLTGKIIINCFQISLVKIVLKIQIWLQLNTFSKC